MEVIASLMAEWHLEYEFFRLADEIGLALPVMDVKARGARERLFDRIGEVDLDLAPHAVMGLMQHHRLPTRLLDWTRRPLIAAFFAASECVKRRARGEKIDHLSVWALNHLALEPDGRIRFFTCPRHGNPNMHAQAGAFVWDTQAEAAVLKDGAWEPFESALPEDLQFIGAPALFRFDLESEHSIELMNLLNVEGFSRAHLMPSFDSVAETILPQWIGDLPPSM